MKTKFTTCNRAAYTDVPFSIHIAGCRDVEKERKNHDAVALDVEGTLDDAIAYVLDDEMRSLGYTEHHVRIFPCCKSTDRKEIPMTTPADTAATIPNTIPTSVISVGLIDPPAWNSRTIKDGALAKEDALSLEDLAASLAAKGLMQPIEVEESNGRYELVFGSRRLAAAKLNMWAQIPAIVRPSSSENERIIRNIDENEKRRNLTTFEQARAFSKLRDIGLKNEDIATKLGRSKTHVSNQISTYKGLPEPILKEWSRNHPVATFDTLKEISQLKDDETKVRAWDDLVNKAAVAAAAGAKPGKRGKGKKDGDSDVKVGYRVVKTNVDLAIDLLSPRKVADERIGGTKKWANDLVQWLIGQRKTPPDGIAFPAKE